MAVGTFVVAFVVFNNVAAASRGTAFGKILTGGFLARNG